MSRAGRRLSRRRRGLLRRCRRPCRGRVAARRAAVMVCRGVSQVSQAIFFLSNPITAFHYCMAEKTVFYILSRVYKVRALFVHCRGSDKQVWRVPTVPNTYARLALVGAFFLELAVPAGMAVYLQHQHRCRQRAGK